MLPSVTVLPVSSIHWHIDSPHPDCLALWKIHILERSIFRYAEGLHIGKKRSTSIRIGTLRDCKAKKQRKTPVEMRLILSDPIQIVILVTYWNTNMGLCQHSTAATSRKASGASPGRALNLGATTTTVHQFISNTTHDTLPCTFFFLHHLTSLIWSSRRTRPVCDWPSFPAPLPTTERELNELKRSVKASRTTSKSQGNSTSQDCSAKWSITRPQSQVQNRSRQHSYTYRRNSTKSLKIKRKVFPWIRFSFMVKESETTENSEPKQKCQGGKTLSFWTLKCSWYFHVLLSSSQILFLEKQINALHSIFMSSYKNKLAHTMVELF